MAAQRITKTLQLIPGKDDDLIAWYAVLPEGQGQELVKAALRRGIQAAPPESAVQSTEGITLLKQLVSLAQQQVGLLRAAQITVPDEDELPAQPIAPRDALLDDIMAGLADWGNQ